jgi:hypothetical protein
MMLLPLYYASAPLILPALFWWSMATAFSAYA